MRTRRKLAVCALLLSAGAAAAAPPALRVCADPANLPFSDSAGEGFENKIAALIADRLHRPLQFVWRAQRRGFLREGLNAGACDLVTAAPLGLAGIAATRPYYRSTYVFVARSGGHAVGSIDDQTLAHSLIGVQLIGDDAINSPPAHLLSRRGLVRNVRGFGVFGDERNPSSARRIVDAVESREIDVAAVWGPVGGYFAAQEKPPLVVSPITQPQDAPIPIAFDIAMAVRKSDPELLSETNETIAALRPQVLKMLSEYNVPVLGD